jgi:pyruvate/2-oxoglutarate/acetoin dehydrogenase E1 component
MNEVTKAAEIATRIHEELHGELEGPVRRLTAPDSSVPAAPGLVAVFYPNAADVVAAVGGMP